jgi:hypothetical protein
MRFLTRSGPRLALLALAAAPFADTGAVDLAALAWIAGCWGAVDREAGSGEYWVRTESGELVGIGRSVEDGRTVSFEFMRIHRHGDGIAFSAAPSCQDETVFALVRYDADEAVFENTANDFPQRIVYRQLSDDRLLARIEGEYRGAQRGVDFPLTRQACDVLAARPGTHTP